MRNAKDIVVKGVRLSTILAKHRTGRAFADLSGAGLAQVDLHGVDLHGADLYEADLSGANLANAILTGADLRGANFRGTDLRGAKLNGANLVGASLAKAILLGANLDWAHLGGANLDQADLTLASLFGTELDPKEQCRKGMVLPKPIKGYKKTKEGAILTAEIPAGAIVFSINHYKCRTNRAKIISTGHHKLLHSCHSEKFTYAKDQEIVIGDFNMAYNVECAAGFHFFRTRKEAEEYATSI